MKLISQKRLTTVVELDSQENWTVFADDTNPTLDDPNLETDLEPQDFNYTEIDSNGDMYIILKPLLIKKVRESKRCWQDSSTTQGKAETW